MVWDTRCYIVLIELDISAIEEYVIIIIIIIILSSVQDA